MDDLVKGLGFDELERKLDNIYNKLSSIISLLDSKKGGKVTIVDANQSAEVKQLAKELISLQKQYAALQVKEKEVAIARQQNIKSDEIAYQNKASKEDTIDTIADQKRMSREAKALMQKQQFEAAILLAQEKLALKKEQLAIKEAQSSQKLALKIEQANLKASIAEEQLLIKNAQKAQQEALKKEGYLNQLTISVQDLTLQYMRLTEAEFKNAKGNVVGTQGKAVLDSLKAQRAELALAEAAYGNYSKNVGNYGSATKMLGINIGQVLKEAPNFAISARIGIMSLTNNLPMLAESFKAVAAEHKAMNAAFKAGESMQKAPSMFSLISKSIFGLTGIMSIAMVLMQIYGADILKWAGKMLKGKDATDMMTQSQKALNKVMSEANGTAKGTVEEVLRLGIEIDKFGVKGKNADEIVKDFNKTFDTHLTTIAEVKAAYPDLARTMIEEAIMMQAALSEIDNASKEFLNKRGAEQRLNTLVSKDATQKKYLDEVNVVVNDLTNAFTELGFSEKEATKYGKELGYGFKLDTKVSEEVIKKANALNTSEAKKLRNYIQDSNLPIVIDLTGQARVKTELRAIYEAQTKYNNAVQAAKTLLPYETDEEKKSGGGGRAKSDREAKVVYVALEYYSKKREQLIKDISELELATEKTTTEGQEQEFSSRYAAIRELMNKKIELNNIDKATSVRNLLSDYDVNKKKIEDAVETNKTLQLSNEERAIADAENAKSLVNLKINLQNDIQKTIDKTDKENLGTQRKAVDDSMKILKEEQTERFRIIRQETEFNLAELEKVNQEEGASEKKRYESTLAFLLNLQGAQMTHEYNVLSLAYEAENKKQNLLIQEVKKKIAANEAIMKSDIYGAKEREAAELEVNKYKEELGKQEVNSANEVAKKRLAIEQYLSERTIELKKETAKTAEEAVFETIKGFYDKYYDLLDEERDYFTDVEKNKERDVKDRLDAGVISETEAENEKERIKVWAESNQKAIDEREKKAKKEQFLLDQAIALGKVWMNYATIAVNPVLAPFALASAIASTALIAAQSIPYFEKGGVASKDTLAVVGEKRHEVIKGRGGVMVTPNIPTLMSLNKGDKVYPSIDAYVASLNIAKSDNKELSRMQIKQDMLRRADNSLLNETKGLRKDIRALKLQSNVKVVNDYTTAVKYANKKRGLIG